MTSPIFEVSDRYILLKEPSPDTVIFCEVPVIVLLTTATAAGGEIVARVGLGITCCLAVVTVGFIGEDKPRVSYATAMDVYIIICFAFVFCALTEFAFIHFLETYVRRIKLKVDNIDVVFVK